MGCNIKAQTEQSDYVKAVYAYANCREREKFPSFAILNAPPPFVG